MTGLWQAGVAGIAAVGLHVAGFALVPVAPGGVQAAGDDGTAQVTLVASSPGIAAMVTTWDRPPTVGDAPTAPVAPDVTPAAQRPAAETTPAMPTATARPPPMTAETAPAMADAPEVPIPAVRPKPRPVRRAEPAPEIAPAPQIASAPVTAPQPGGSGTAGQVAAGTGGGATAGSGSPAAAGTQAGGAAGDLQAGWGAAIRTKIERNKRYPADATATGTVRLRLTVGTDGRLQGLAVLRSSGDALLDAAAISAVQRAGRFARAPAGMPGATSFTLNISFER